MISKLLSKKYYILICYDITMVGVAAGDILCGPESFAITSETFWAFEVAQYTSKFEFC